MDAVSSSRRCRMNSSAWTVASFAAVAGSPYVTLKMRMSESVAAVTIAVPRNEAGVSPGTFAASDDPYRDVRRHGDLRLRLGDPLWVLVDGREILDPGEAAREILVLEEDLRCCAVERRLARRLVVRGPRDCGCGEHDDPPSPLQDAECAYTSWVVVTTETVHSVTPSYPDLPGPESTTPVYPTLRLSGTSL